MWKPVVGHAEEIEGFAVVWITEVKDFGKREPPGCWLVRILWASVEVSAQFPFPEDATGN